MSFHLKGTHEVVTKGGGLTESCFSLEIHAIQPLAVFGTRRRTALRGEGFEWVPDL